MFWNFWVSNVNASHIENIKIKESIKIPIKISLINQNGHLVKFSIKDCVHVEIFLAVTGDKSPMTQTSNFSKI